LGGRVWAWRLADSGRAESFAGATRAARQATVEGAAEEQRFGSAA
jgi:hypothetical protein